MRNISIPVIAGTDEAGRGPLAGPVVAAAVVMDNGQRDILLSSGLGDSKKISAPSRERLFRLMIELGVVWKAQAASHVMIDRINILQASLWCMRRSVEKLSVRPDLVLIDGNKLLPRMTIAQKAIIKGDDRVPVIAAASIVAKVLRDRIMVALDTIYPEYGFKGHKGYPSTSHREVLKNIGPSPVHRLSFNGVIQDKNL